MRGEISELLGKAINRGALDQELSGRDKERMLAFLRQYGDLSPDLLYEGSPRAGYKALPGPAGPYRLALGLYLLDGGERAAVGGRDEQMVLIDVP